MKRKILTLASSFILSSAIYAQDINIQNGWQLLGATEDINVSAFDNSCVDFVWKYDNTNILNPHWKIHIANGQSYNYTGSTITSLNQGDGFWVKGNNVSGCDINMAEPSTFSFTNNTIAGKTFYSYQYDEWGIVRSETYYDANGTSSTIDCHGNSGSWQNCENPNIVNWMIQDAILTMSKVKNSCSESWELHKIDSTDTLIFDVKNYINSCNSSENCTDCGTETMLTTNLTPDEALLSKFKNKKLQNDSETYYFRDNDIVLGDTGTDLTKIGTYGGIVDGKLKVILPSGIYDLISKTTNGFLVEFFIHDGSGGFQSDGSQIAFSWNDKHSVQTNTTLEDFTQTEIDNVLSDM